ncbi:UNVERIFIED_CONTAM: hypothetical protein PYX00_008737 [Menopon gallinae]|uniref:Uncharacterized protein n=1 Tax=Menopon gallinae TaxID=328185 RepID=A0AAW2HPJ2_9NEOP
MASPEKSQPITKKMTEMTINYSKKAPSTTTSFKRKVTKEKIRYSTELDDLNMDILSALAHTPVSTDRSLCDFNMDDRGSFFDSDVESEPDRSNPNWKISCDISEEELVVQDAEETELRLQPSLWDTIMEDYESERKQLSELNTERQPYEQALPKRSKLTAVQYLEENIFPVLCPALEDTLFQAKKEDCLQIQKCVFNGLDNISELLWNRNDRHPRRKLKGHKNIFDIPFVKIWLHLHPRPIYPLSWVWTTEEAITVLQSYIRRYFVCRDPECCEMRKFWQIFKQEKMAELRMKELEHIQEVEEIVGDILSELAASAVYKATWKTHGCFCISKPCKCECKCFKWCKCCRCSKQEKSVSNRFCSDASMQRGKSIAQ